MEVRLIGSIRQSARKPVIAGVLVFSLILIALLVFCTGTAKAAFSFSSGTIGVSTQQSTATTAQTLTSENKLDIVTLSDAGSSAQLAEPTAHAATGVAADDTSTLAAAQSTITGAYATDDRSVAIDAFLAGTPMDGCGSTFVAAADAYGLDARLLPAISRVESGNGANCFLPYNGWGYGHYSWSSWDEAIWAVAAGVSRGYGSDATPESMEGVYCAAPWGSKVRGAMESIY